MLSLGVFATVQGDRVPVQGLERADPIVPVLPAREVLGEVTTVTDLPDQLATLTQLLGKGCRRAGPCHRPLYRAFPNLHQSAAVSPTQPVGDGLASIVATVSWPTRRLTSHVTRRPSVGGAWRVRMCGFVVWRAHQPFVYRRSLNFGSRAERHEDFLV